MSSVFAANTADDNLRQNDDYCIEMMIVASK